MRAMVPMIVPAAVLAAALAAGCGPAREGPAAGGAGAPAYAETAGPRALLGQWHRALVSGDKTAYVACFAGAEDDLVLALAIFESIQASYEFQKAVIAVYGQDAWKAFETSDASRVDIFPRDPAWPMRLTVVRMGTVSLVYTPRGRVPLHLGQDGGAWRIHASCLVPPGLDAKRAAKYLFQWADALKKLAAQVSGKTVAAEKASKDVMIDFEARLAPAERPDAAAAKAMAAY